MITLTTKQRAALRSMAMTLSPIFQIGKGGISEEMTRQIDAALEARELIKIKVLKLGRVEVHKKLCFYKSKGGLDCVGNKRAVLVKSKN